MLSPLNATAEKEACKLTSAKANTLIWNGVLIFLLITFPLD
jgi:hypothetical protein